MYFCNHNLQITMQKIYYLTTCDTCKRIIKELDLPSTFVRQEIKEEEITVIQLEALRALSGSYESLFSKRAKR
ncbi:MAG: arsenate reductase, partial [Patiriisocius sp.]